jgi:hypothetical protein
VALDGCPLLFSGGRQRAIHLHGSARELSQAHPSATSIFIDKLDACGFQGAPYDLQRSAARGMDAGLQLANRYYSNPRVICEILLAPTNKPASRPALRGSNHQKSPLATLMSKKD